MEKRYLVINKNGRMIGAFEGVDRFEEFENGISFTSEEGSFDYEKGEDGIYRCDENPITFDSYELLGRRAVNKRLSSGSVKDVRHKDDYILSNTYDRIEEEPAIGEHSSGKNRIICDDCTPTSDRRPTTVDDIEEDIHVIDFDNSQELYEYILDREGWDDDEIEGDTIYEKVNNLVGYFNDPGDGSTNYLYVIVDGQECESAIPYDCLDGLDLANIKEDKIKERCIEQFADEFDF